MVDEATRQFIKDKTEELIQEHRKTQAMLLAALEKDPNLTVVYNDRHGFVLTSRRKELNGG